MVAFPDDTGEQAVEFLQSHEGLHRVVDDGLVPVLITLSSEPENTRRISRTHHPYLFKRGVVLQRDDVIGDRYKLQVV